jgi:hypothetical protein
VKSQAGSVQVLARFWVGLGRVGQFENKMLKVGKRFLVLKIINHFSKIKEEFSVKENFFFTIILRRTKTPEIRKIFYNKTNGALVMNHCLGPRKKKKKKKEAQTNSSKKAKNIHIKKVVIDAA